MNAATALFLEALHVTGLKVTVYRADCVSTVTASIQPFEPAAAAPAWRQPMPPGYIDRAKYLYIGPAEETLHGVVKLVCRDKTYEVIRAEQWHLGEEPHHTEALLAVRGGGPS